MKKILFFGFLALIASASQAQITITAADMPVLADTLRYSYAQAAGSSLNLSNTGTNIAWDYSSLTPVLQGLDQYKSAAQVNIAYAAVISPMAYGYKVADSIPGLSASPIPITVNNIYTFFVKTSAKFQAEGFGALVSGFPVPAAYSDPDEWYLFPLTYGNSDSISYALTVTIPGGLATLKQKGYRKTTVDGWGTIKTPFFTTPVNAIRVRSEIVELDSVIVTGMAAIPIPRHMAEYKWLANGEHYPALWVTATIAGSTETPTTVQYRDHYRALGVNGPASALQMLEVFPNPAVDGILNIKLPAGWMNFTTEVFDMQGRLLQSGSNNSKLDIHSLPKGQYLIRVQSGSRLGIATVTL